MEFKQYANSRQRELDTNGNGGRVRRGQLLSPAPGGVWIIPHPRENGDPKVALLGHRSPDGTYYALETEQ